MAGNIVTVTRLPTTDAQLREELLERIEDLADFVYEAEPGTKKYAAFIPREDDGKSVWTIEEYASPKAFEAHTNSEAAQALHTWLQSVPIFSEADQPTSFSLQYLGPEFEFSRPEATQNADPHVIFAELDYSPGGSATAVPYWKAVVETGRGREPGTLAYGVMRDLDQEEKLATFEAYESADYLKDDHVASDAIAASIANTKHLRTGLKQHLLKRVLGFLYKD